MTRAKTLQDLLDRQVLRRLAGARSFERGEEYLAAGLVRGLAEDQGTVTANVDGTSVYRVELRAGGGEVDYSCTCPLGSDGAFCKHCVAVGLAWLERGRPPRKHPGKGAQRATTMNDVRALLAGQDKEALVDQLMELAMADDRLRQRLLLQAARRSPQGVDLAAYREAIDGAVGRGGFVEYRDAHDYARGIEAAVDPIEELLAEGHAAEVVELTEHALTAVEGALESVDDSDGAVGGIRERLEELHHRACAKARPDPEALARRLFEWELKAQWDTFSGAAARYADVLGSRGVAVYRRLAAAEWARVPPLGPGQDDPHKYGRRFRITSIMETLARQAGDIEALVEVKKRDLSSAYGHLQIAEIYRAAGKHDLALEWAERGVKAFPGRPDPRLHAFLAEEYHRRDRHDEAMALVWDQFTGHPDLAHYQDLKQHADRIDRWPAWREKALASMRAATARAREKARGNRLAWRQRVDHSEMVRVFLWEKDTEAAWREAKEGGCSNDLWLQLAARRERAHPEDALAVFQGQIEPVLDRKNDDAYHEAVRLLRKIHDLMGRLGRADEFTGYLASIRAAHRPKRNLMKLLDQARW